MDEVWWSRLAQPKLHSWTEGEFLRLEELEADRNDPQPKALACYGVLRNDTKKLMLRFVEGRPVSALTIHFFEWVCQQLHSQGKKALLLIWDNASWHVSQTVRNWLKQHNRQAKAKDGVRIVVCHLPTKSPWLNRIEPYWMHGKKAIAEPARKLDATELGDRVCDFFGCDLLPLLSK
jgi:hypothetical protein